MDLLTAARSKPRPFDVVIAADHSRLIRDQDDQGLKVLVRECGVRVFYAETGQGKLLNNGFDKFRNNVDGFFAEQYAEFISTKTRGTLHHKAKLGYATGAKVFGYRSVRKGDHSELETWPEQVAVIVRAFEMSAEGHGDLRIVRALGQDHHALTGRRLNKVVVRGWLRNDLYRGVLIYGKTRVVGKKVSEKAKNSDGSPKVVDDRRPVLKTTGSSITGSSRTCGL